jgi:hypothetical protein
MQRMCRWTTEEGEGLEHFTLAQTEEGFAADGVIVGPSFGAMFTGELFGCSYAVRCDARWRVRRVQLRVAGGATLLLRGDGEGHWSGVDGDPLPALDGCIDIDITGTPFTNTLPIRRLGERLHERQEIHVAYITLPEASVAPSRQAYTALGAGRYLFESLSHPFQAEIVTDADGLVVDYPGLFRRITG